MAIKVCHVTSMHPVFDTRIFIKECGSLQKKYEVYLVASNVENQIKDGIHIIGVSMPPHGIRKMLTTKPIIDAAMKVDADVYHFHDPELMAVGVKFKKKGKKIIFDYHENYAEYLLTKEWVPRLLRKPFSKFFLLFEKRYLSKYNYVITVTPHILERLLTYNKNTVQITNYPIYQDIEDNRKWGKSVCFVGGIIPEWMHYNIIEALSNTTARYHLAGPVISDSYLNRLKESKGWSKVEYTGGRISYDKVFNYIQECSAGLAISTYNDPNAGYKQGTLGVNKLFEYMMAGIPIIASELVLWKEIIDKYDCGICVDPDDINSIATAIDYLVSNPEVAKIKGDNGKKAAAQYFNWSTQESILYDVYNKLIESDN